MAGVLFVLCIPTEVTEDGYSQTNIDEDEESLNSKPPPIEATSKFGPRSHPKLSSTKQSQVKHNDPLNDSYDDVLISIEKEPKEYGKKTKIPRSEPISIDDNVFGSSSSPFSGHLKRIHSDTNLSLTHSESGEQCLKPNNNKLRKSWDGYIKDLMTGYQNKQSPVAANVADSLDLNEDASMESVVKAILKKMKVKSALWQRSDLGDVYHIMFSVESGYTHEKMLTMLKEWGIGEREGSSVSIIPCTLLHKPMREVDADGIIAQHAIEQNQGAWNRFMNSMRARLNVAQIVEEVKQDATITFDFLTLLIIAGVLAAFGLVEDSTIFLASSMLISPLMGPIIAATFGTVIKDHKLTKIGIVNELIGISVTTVVGFVFGLIMCTMDERYGIGEGLTSEMLSRCEIHSLLVGIYIAIPSGAAVAISILGEKTGSLIGVAISASLLPPAVNSGVLWALAVIFLFHQKDETQYNKVIKTNEWSDNQAIELAVMGCLSMAVTVTNVICVYATGTLFLKIKEVAPIVSRNQRQFWKHDVKVARDFNNFSLANNGGDSGSSLTQKLAEEFAEFQENDPELVASTADHRRNGVGNPSHQHTWSPMMFRQHDAANLSIQEMEKIFLNMAHPLQSNNRHTRHYRADASGSSKTVNFNRSSPPKYRSVLNDHIFGSQRRSSVPLYSSSVGAEPPHYSRFSKLNDDQLTKSPRLPNIPEIRSQDIPSPRTSSETGAVDVTVAGALNIPPKVDVERRLSSGSGRTFTVTATVDPLYTHFN